MSDYPTGNWHSSPNASPAPSPLSQNIERTYERNNPYDTPYQCGICYEYLTGDVDELDVHIDHHKRELARRVRTQNSQLSGDHQHPYQGGSGVPHYYYATSAASQVLQPGFEGVPQRFRDARQQIHIAPDMRHHEEIFYQPQSSSNVVTTESWSRTEPTSSTQEDYQQMAKKPRYTHQTFEESRDDSGICNEPDASAGNSAAVLQQTEQTFTNGQDNVAYHELQPAKTAGSSSEAKSLQSFNETAVLDQNQEYAADAKKADAAPDEALQQPTDPPKSETDENPLSDCETRDTKKDSKDDVSGDEKARRSTRRSVRTLHKDFVRK